MQAVYLGSAGNASDTNSPSFTGFSLGTARVDRYIAVCSVGRKSGTAVAPTTSVTVGGAGLTEIRQASNIATNLNNASIWGGIIASGTSADIVVNYTSTGTMLRTGIAVFAFYGLESVTPFDHDASTANDPSVALDIPNRGVCIGISCSSGAVTASWTGITEQVDVAIEGTALQMTSAFALLNAETGRTIQSAWTGNTNPVLAAASWKFKAPDRVRIFTTGGLNYQSLISGGRL